MHRSVGGLHTAHTHPPETEPIHVRRPCSTCRPLTDLPIWMSRTRCRANFAPTLVGLLPAHLPTKSMSTVRHPQSSCLQLRSPALNNNAPLGEVAYPPPSSVTVTGRWLDVCTRWCRANFALMLVCVLNGVCTADVVKEQVRRPPVQTHGCLNSEERRLYD